MTGNILRAATAALVSAGIGVTGLALAGGTAHAGPLPAPMYHWCPGDFWDPGWGFNWEGGVCHDDWHRDIDGDWHGRDWHPDGDRGGDWHPNWDRGGDWHPDWDRGGDWHPDWDRGGWQPWWPH
jgi:hypothetical protein